MNLSLTAAVDWSEVTAIATAVLALSFVAAIVAAVWELDYFEQLAALESRGAFDLELIRLLLGRTLIERWEMWRPALHEAHRPRVYPMFEGLAQKLGSSKAA